MKRILITFLIIISFLTFGCEKLKLGNDFISKAPGVDVTKDTIFSSLEYATRFLTSCYYYLPYGLCVGGPDGPGTAHDKIGMDVIEAMTDLSQCDLGWAGLQTYTYQGLVDPSSANWVNGYSGIPYGFTDEETWKGIRNCFIFLENIHKVPNVAPDYLKRLKAEAWSIIAIEYYDMFRHFGGLPWINHAFKTGEDLSKFPRLTAQAYCDSIVAVIDKHVGDLPWALSASEDPQWDGRLTQAGMLAIKARLLLFNASPLFNDAAPYLDGDAAQQKLVWHGGYDKNLWKRAADAAHDLIDKVESTSDYQFYHKAGNSYRQDFTQGYSHRGSSEILISTRTEFYTATWDWAGYQFDLMAAAFGANNPTDDYVKMFQMTNGKSITDPTSGYDSTNPYINRDPRLYESVLVNGDAYQGRTAELYVGGRERLTDGQDQNKEGYQLRKFIYDADAATMINGVVQFPLIRLEEVYLTFAEADNEFNGGPSAEGYRCINLVRARVGMPPVTPGMTQVEFREAILLERAVEFYQEEVRWNDLTRWKRDFDLSKTLHGMEIYQSETDPTKFTYVRSLCSPRYWQKNWSPKWYLSPFPQDEINKNYGLVQNPGW
jgi:hypothetical protein